MVRLSEQILVLSNFLFFLLSGLYLNMKKNTVLPFTNFTVGSVMLSVQFFLFIVNTYLYTSKPNSHDNEDITYYEKLNKISLILCSLIVCNCVLTFTSVLCYFYL